MKENYIYWLLNDSNEPYDEILYLIDTILQSNKKEVIEETLQYFKNEQN